jgi:hypothetical protein
MTGWKVLSMASCIGGFLMPFLVYQISFASKTFAPSLAHFLYGGTNHWLYLAVIFWCISVVLWGDRSRYWVMWTLAGVSSCWYLINYFIGQLP